MAVTFGRPLGGHAPIVPYCHTEAVEVELDFGKLSITEDGDGCNTKRPTLENHFFLQINEVRFLLMSPTVCSIG